MLDRVTDMDYPDYRPHAIAAMLFLSVIIVGSVAMILRREKTFAHVGQVLGWDLLALGIFLGVLGSVGAGGVSSWLGLIFWGGLLISWVRMGIKGFKSSKRTKTTAGD